MVFLELRESVGYELRYYHESIRRPGNHIRVIIYTKEVNYIFSNFEIETRSGVIKSKPNFLQVRNKKLHFTQKHQEYQPLPYSNNKLSLF